MDNYREEIVVRKSGKFLYTLAYIVVWVLIVIFGFFALMDLSVLMGLNFEVASIIRLILYGGLAVFLFYYKDNLRTEYEYTFTNGEIDFAKVLGNRRRKNLMSLRMREVEAGGYVTSAQFERYGAMRDVKKINYFLNSSDELYFLYFIREGRKQLLVFEPSQTMVDMMRQYSKVLDA